MEQGIDDKYLYENYEDVADVLEEFLEDLDKLIASSDFLIFNFAICKLLLFLRTNSIK